jgi:hypothetical protein
MSMSNDFNKLSAQRDNVLAQLQSLDRLRRGSLSRQVYVRKKQGASASPQGPYYVLQGFHQGKKFSRRIPAEQAPQVEQAVANYKRFQALADQCVTLTDQLTQIAEGRPDSKKNSSRRKSSKSSSGKPPPL